MTISNSTQCFSTFQQRLLVSVCLYVCTRKVGEYDAGGGGERLERSEVGCWSGVGGSCCREKREG